MLEIFWSMIKEEWRIHSTMYGSLLFAFFPILIMIFSFIGSLTFPIFTVIMPIKQMALLLHYAFVLFGLSIGAFGLLGREVLNRRFGSISLLTFSSRTLPISLKNIFANFLVKDILYYFVLWILPFAGGFFFATFFLSINPALAGILLLSLTLSFLLGMSLVFVLSTIYVYSLKLLACVLLLVSMIILAFSSYLNLSLNLLPSYTFFMSPSINIFMVTLALILIPSVLSVFYLKVDFPEKKRKFKNRLDSLSLIFSFSRQSNFISKDFLDLQRSEGGLGKIIFSFIFPVALVWIIIYTFTAYFPQMNLFILFSILLGAISSSIYNWLTEYDVLSSYSFLPIEVSTIIKSKLVSYVIMNLASLVILILATFTIGKLELFIPALMAFISVSAYTLTATIYVAGLRPNSLLYSAKVFLQYVILIIPVLLIMIFLSVFNPLYLIVSPIFILPSILLIKKSFKKWNSWEQ